MSRCRIWGGGIHIWMNGGKVDVFAHACSMHAKPGYFCLGELHVNDGKWPPPFFMCCGLPFFMCCGAPVEMKDSLSGDNSEPDFAALYDSCGPQPRDKYISMSRGKESTTYAAVTSESWPYASSSCAAAAVGMVLCTFRRRAEPQSRSPR